MKGAVKEIAKDLVQLYASRQNSEGFQCGPDTVWQREFEEMFPYEETEDQLDAIEATKRIWRAERSWTGSSAGMGLRKDGGGPAGRV